MIFWICGVLTLAAGVSAAFVSNVRTAALALWICGLGVGGIYLSLGAELLAIVQWLVSTLVAISFIFYAVTFGEYGATDSRPMARRLLDFALPLLLGVAFVGVVWLGYSGLPKMTEFVPAPSGTGQSLVSLGRILAEENFLSLEVLALTLFLVIVGSGVVARPETPEPDVKASEPEGSKA